MVTARTRRDRHRADEGEGEFGEERAGQAGLKADRDINRDQHDGHGDDRPAEFARGLNGSGDRFHAVVKMPIDVFDHDDRVVDNQTDRQHQRQ